MAEPNFAQKKEENFASQNFLPQKNEKIKIQKTETKKIEKNKKLKPAKNGQIYFGAFPDFGGSEEKVSAKKIQDFEKLVGHKIFWAYFSQNFYQGLKFPKKEIAEIRQAGAVPFVRLLPHSKAYNDYAYNQKNFTDKFSLEKILDGKFDAEFRAWAKEAKKDGKMILVDFSVEPNGNWFVWSGKYHGAGIKDKYGNKNYPDGPEKWRDAYRHIIDIFREEGANNLTYFFHPDINSIPDEWWNQPKYYYPGDGYIDWIGFSLYGPQNPKEEYWEKFSETLTERSEKIREISDKKPLAVLEFGVSDDHPLGKKSDWLKDAFETILSGKILKFSAFAYWHENWEEEDDLWAKIRVDSSAESLKTFRELLKNKKIFGEVIGGRNFAEPNFAQKKEENFASQNFLPKQKERKKIIQNQKTWYQPKPGISWHWQLEGKIKTNFNVDLYDIDLFETPQRVIDELHRKGKKVICYFNAGAWEPYRDDSSKFPKEVRGKIMEGWDDERWLDIKNYQKFSHLILARLDLAKQKKCDGVEPDNIDGYQNKTGFNLSYSDQLKFNKWLAREAHKRNLAIALKNDLDQIKDLEKYFDFAVNEECFEYDECEKLLPFIKNNKAVLGVEYTLPKSKFCSKAKAMKFSWIKMKDDYALDGFRDACE